MAKQTINTGLSANDRTGDTLRTTGLKINANFTELYDVLGGSNIGSGTSQLTDSGLDILGTSARTKLGAVGGNVEVNIDLPDSSGTVLVNTAVQTMSNKTLDSAQLNNPSLLNISMFDDNSSHKYSIVAGSLTANHNLNVPSLTDSDTLVLNNNSATITNKNIISPVIGRPRIHEYLADSLGNAVLSFTDTFSPSRNNVKISDKGAGTAPVIEAIGTDGNINLDLVSKGTGSVNISKAAVSYATAANSQAAPVSAGFVSLTGSSSGTVTLANGTVNGEIKIFARRGGGSGTVTLAPATFAQGTSIEFDPLDTAQLIWDGSNGWNIIGGYGYAVV
tara:strand:- start:871 stop:1872 length:1002 start_codon:yes stop_codon:yes gene_type:complete